MPRSAKVFHTTGFTSKAKPQACWWPTWEPMGVMPVTGRARSAAVMYAPLHVPAPWKRPWMTAWAVVRTPDRSCALRIDRQSPVRASASTQMKSRSLRFEEKSS